MIIRAHDFNLKHTLSSGQIFRYAFKEIQTENQDDTPTCAVIFSRDIVFSATQHNNQLFIDGVSRKFARHFLGLDHELAPILASINTDEHINSAITTYSGLRIMQQDPWECLVNFICSSCASIPKITINLNALCKQFGTPLSFESTSGHSFPEPGALHSLSLLKKAKSGFRAKYLQKVNKININQLYSLHTLPYTEAKQWLMQHDGIGEKIADCILLFSCRFYQAFPVDTWVSKVIRELYFQETKDNTIHTINSKQCQEFGKNYFGAYAGYAQQYLFHWRRNHQRK